MLTYGAQQRLLQTKTALLSLFLLCPSLLLWAQAPDPDLNDDGVVNILDASIVGSCFGQDPAANAQCQLADTDGDGDVDMDDLNFVIAAFGQTGFPTDTVPPTIIATVSPTPNAAGWNNSDVTVTFECQDNEPGVVCPAPVSVMNEGANQTVGGTARDAAGNETTTSVVINLDKTPPDLTAAVDPAPNAAGWNKTDVTVSFDASDALSGVENTTQDTTLSKEGANQIVKGVATDVAGNTSAFDQLVNLDKTKPTVSAPAAIVVAASDANGTPTSNTGIASFLVGATATDAVAGLLDAEPVGFPDPFPLGATLVTFQAEDPAGNIGTSESSVTVADQTPPIVTPPADLTVPASDTTGAPADDPAIVAFLDRATAVDNVDGSFAATAESFPDPFPVGTTTITFVATDAAGNIGTASSNLTVDDTVLAPDAVDDIATTVEETPVDIDVLANDLSPSGVELTVVSITSAGNGLTSINVDGTVRYTPDEGFVGADRFDYTVDDGSGETDVATVTIDVGPLPLTLIETSPANGEEDVAVTRETIVRFSNPLNESTVVTDSQLFAEFAGQRLNARIHVSPDRRTVSLFYFDALPASARIRVTLIGDDLLDKKSRPVDADADGAPGGSTLVDFDTLTLTTLEGTSVSGRVFASELGDGGTNVPLAGVTISVDGMEAILRSTTDSMGNFRLDPAPVGKFFVHIDGRTATNGIPDGAYYPFVGKPFRSTAGRDRNVGDIHLPLIVPGTLQDVSSSVDTEITFPSAVLVGNPELAGVTLTVPADSLFSDDGTRGGMVGIAPVAPDRLPGELPEGLEFPLVITVQTDGPTNFDEPAPICFPNIDDPVLQRPLDPGTKDFLYSFNHDMGIWEAIGPATVSADGRLICTDPGVGIVAPGWHGTGPPPLGPGPCRSACCQSGGGSGPEGGGPNSARRFDAAASTMELARFNTGLDTQSESNSCGTCHLDDCKQSCLDLFAICLQRAAIDTGTCVIGVDPVNAVGCAAATPLLAGLCTKEKDICLRQCNNSCSQSNSLLSPVNLNQVDNFSQANDGSAARDLILEKLGEIDDLLRPFALSGETPTPDVIDQVARLRVEASEAGGGDPVALLRQQLLQLERATNPVLGTSGEFIPFPPQAPVLYRASVMARTGLFELRGSTGPFGQYQLFTPREASLVGVRFYDPRSRQFGRASVTRVAPSRIAHPQMVPVDQSFADFDADGLADEAEYVIGTEPNLRDTDADGISDGAEVDQGTDPLDGVATRTGIISTVDTPGTALDVCAINDVAVVADGNAGVTVLNVFNGMDPVAIARIDTPGRAQSVSCGGSLVAVAVGDGGLSVIDVSDPPSARIVHQITRAELGGNANTVVVTNDLAFVGGRGGAVTSVDLLTGTALDAVDVGDAVEDISLARDHVYALTEGRMYVIPLAERPLRVSQSVGSPGVKSQRRLRLFVGSDMAYATLNRGYNTFDITGPSSPSLIASGETAQFGWKHIVTNGSGLGIAAVGPNSTDDGPHHVSVYDVTDPLVTDSFLTQFEAPGIASSVSIFNGLAYVADGERGLQVVNFLPYDNQEVPPTISLATSFASGLAEEGKRIRVTATVFDDVQVRNVEFRVNRERVLTDGNFPFEFSFTTPLLSQASDFTLSALATDTGDNATLSEVLTVTLVPDATPPSVIGAAPDRSNVSNDVNGVAVFFSEPMNPSSLNGSLRVREIGADGLFDTLDDRIIEPTQLTYREELLGAFATLGETLAPGFYRGEVDATVSDVSGLTLPTPFTWTFAVFRPGEKGWIGGDPADPTNWSNPNNWSPVGVPTSADSVTIVPVATAPRLTSNQSVLDLFILANGRLDTASFTLNVGRNAIGDGAALGGGTVRMTGGGEIGLAGLPNLLVDAGTTVRVTRPLNVAGSVSLPGAGTVLDVTGNNVTVAGGLSTGTQFGGGGLLRMLAGDYTLSVGGSASFNSGGSTFAGGTLAVGGNFSTGPRSGFGSFASSGTKVLLNGSSLQTVSLPPERGNRFADVEVTNPTEVRFLSPWRVDRSLVLASSGLLRSDPTLTTAGSITNPGGGTLAIQVIEHSGTGALTLPTTLATTLSLTGGGDVQLPAGFNLDGSLSVLNAGTVLDVTGNDVDVTGGLSTGTQFGGSGLLRMLAGDYTFSVGGSASFNSPGSTFAGGTLAVGGSFSTGSRSGFGAFASSGTKVLLNGSSLQTVSVPPEDGNRFADVEVTNPTEVRISGNWRVDRSLVLATSGLLQSGNTLTTAGSITNPGGGTLAIQVIEHSGTGALTIPTPLATTLRLTGGSEVQLPAGFNLDGSLSVLNTGTVLDVTGNDFNVTESLATSGGLLRMLAGDYTLSVGGSASFNSGGNTFAGGTLAVGANFSTGPFFNAFASTGTKVLLNGSALQTVSVPREDRNRFADVEVTNPTQVRISKNTRIDGVLSLSGPGTLESGFIVDVGGALHSPTNATPIVALNSLLVAGGADVNNLILDDAQLTFNGGTFLAFDNVVFRNYSDTAVQLRINHTELDFSMRGLRFATTPTTGLYISAADTDGSATPTRLTIENSQPSNGIRKVSTSGGFIIDWGAPDDDTDGDGLTDDEEIDIHGTDPLNPDSDSDGIPDGIEVDQSSDPLRANATPLTDGTSNADQGSLVADQNGDLHVVWVDDRTGAAAIFYSMLNAGGGTLIDDTQLSDAGSVLPARPHNDVDTTGKLHVVWSDELGVVSEVIHTTIDPGLATKDGSASSDVALTVITDRRISDDDAVASFHPQVVVDSFGRVNVLWSDVGSIRYLQLNLAGDVSIAERVIFTGGLEGSALPPSVSIDSRNNIHAAWSNRKGTASAEIFYALVDGNSGAPLVDSFLVTDDDGLVSSFPSISVDPQDRATVVFQDSRLESQGFSTEVFLAQLSPYDGSGGIVSSSELKTLQDRLVSDDDGVATELPAARIASGSLAHVMYYDGYGRSIRRGQIHYRLANLGQGSFATTALSQANSATSTVDFTLPRIVMDTDIVYGGVAPRFFLWTDDSSGTPQLFLQITGSDPDRDGLLSDKEVELATDPLDPDTDADGLGDGREINLENTDPLKKDSDGGGRSDGEEVLIDGTDPNDPSDDLTL